MSATDWGTCPRCFSRVKEEYLQREVEIRDSYGKVPAEEYFESLKALGTSPDFYNFKLSFREDYEIYITEEGQFNIHYSGKCQDCGLKHNFEHQEIIKY